MAKTEVERRFLVAVQPDGMGPPTLLRQGYLAPLSLPFSMSPVVRVRVVHNGFVGPDEAFMTVKGPGLGSRREFEYALPVADAEEMLGLCGGRVVEKRRRRLGRWEVDEFLGPLAGLWIAEHELGEGEAMPELPGWVGVEVTDDPLYSNAALASRVALLARGATVVL